MRIQTKLSLLFGLLLAGVVLFIGGGILWEEQGLLREKMAEADRDVLAQFAQTCRDAVLVRDDLALVNAVRAVMRHRAVVEAYYVTPEGRAGAHSDDKKLGLPLSVPSADTVLEGDRRSLARSVPLNEGAAGRAVIVFSLQRIDRTVRNALRDLVRRTVVLSLIGLLIGWTGAWLLGRHLLDPIHRLAEGTRRVSRGDLSHRLSTQRADELGRLSADFNAMSERLGELDKMKKDFVSNVTHELRSPLSAIESTVNMLSDNFRSGRLAGAIDYFNIIRNNTARLGRFINNLLDLSRLEARRWDLDRREQPVDEALKEVADLYGPGAREKGVDLRREPIPEGLTLVADPDKVQQILNNLVGNALKFTPSGGTVVLAGGWVDENDPRAVQARAAGAKESSGYVFLSVGDNGPGIAPRDQERIFDRFERVAESQGTKTPGTGLGLAICRGWAEAHGGAVVLDSAPGQGSLFSVYFPERRRPA